MWLIFLLVVIGILLTFAELVLPGITVAAVGAALCFITSVVIGFIYEGTTVGCMTLAAITIFIILMLIFFFRPKTWKKVTLQAEIKDACSPDVSEKILIGTEAITLTRLAPMGTVLINGVEYEAKCREGFIDPKSKVSVIGYDNSSLVVVQDKFFKL